MKTTLILTFAIMVLSAGIFAFRHRELRTLQSRATVLRESVKAAPAARDQAPGTADLKSIIEDIRAFLAEGGDPERGLALQNVLKAMSADELVRLVRGAKDMPSPPEHFLATAAHLIIPVLAEKDVEKAMSAATELPLNLHPFKKLFTRTLQGWMMKEPGPASVWIKTALATGKLDNYGDREHMPMMAAMGAVMAAPVESLESIRREPVEMQRSLLLSAAKFLKTSDDARAFAAAMVTWPPMEMREHLLSTVLEKVLEHESFDTAAAWLDGLPDPAPEQKSEARIALAMHESGAPEMPQRADWILSAAGPAAQPAVAAQLIAAWVLHDHDAAGSWLNANRTSQWYDAGAQAFATGIRHKEPATAFDWTLTISDETRRRAALQSVMRQWKRDNPEAALDYVRKADLPEVWKAEFEEPEKAAVSSGP